MFICNFHPTYLGLPLSYKRLPRASLQPVLDGINRRLSALPMDCEFLYGCWEVGAHQSVITSIPIYLSIAMELPPWLLQAIEKRIRAFFWKGSDAMNGGQCLGPSGMGAGVPAGGVWRPGNLEPTASWFRSPGAMAVVAENTHGLLERTETRRRAGGAGHVRDRKSVV